MTGMKTIPLTRSLLAGLTLTLTAQAQATSSDSVTLFQNVRIFDGALKRVTRDNAELLALSGLRNHYPGKLGVIEEGALADLLLVDGDPLADLSLIGDPARNFPLIMKDGKVYKNTVK